MKDATYRSYLLTILLIIFAFNYIDRLALAMVLQDVKREFVLTDSQLGLLTGFAFALFYSLMGIPIARWADRGNRVTIITVTTVLWSVMVTLCGFAGSFVQLLFIRIGVAVGEAGCVPPAHSLIPDYFDRSERPRAVAVYMLGGPLSVVAGYFLAGWLNELYGWRATFVILGVPGILLALLARVTLREPRFTRSQIVTTDRVSPPPPVLSKVIITLWRNTTFRHLLFAFAIVHFFTYGITQWQPSFFIRSHGMQTGELGTWMALIWGVGSALGIYAGGVLASRYAAHNETLQLRSIAVVYAIFSLLSIFIYLSPDTGISLGLMGLSAVIVGTNSGPLFATIQTLVPAHMRATSIAFVYLVANLVGMGLGPLAAGVLSDVLAPVFGEESLRYALVLLCPGYLWVAAHLWVAGKTVKRDLSDAHEKRVCL